ncbi:Uncharacterised protein [Streptococcus pneumoniae]|nr:Uncharacterised protein [Streptococcus pneumoniae]
MDDINRHTKKIITKIFSILIPISSYHKAFKFGSLLFTSLLAQIVVIASPIDIQAANPLIAGSANPATLFATRTPTYLAAAPAIALVTRRKP